MLQRLTKKQFGGVFGFGKKKSNDKTAPVKKTGKGFLNYFRRKPVPVPVSVSAPASEQNLVHTNSNEQHKELIRLAAERGISKYRYNQNPIHSVSASNISSAKTKLGSKVEEAKRIALQKQQRKSTLHTTHTQKVNNSRKDNKMKLLLNNLSNSAPQRSRFKKFRNAAKHTGHRIANAARRTKKIIGNTYTKTVEGTKRRFAANRVKINEFVDKIKEMIKKFMMKSEVGQDPALSELLSEKLTTVVNIEISEAEEQSQEQDSVKEEINNAMLVPNTNTIKRKRVKTKSGSRRSGKSGHSKMVNVPIRRQTF